VFQRVLYFEKDPTHVLIFLSKLKKKRKIINVAFVKAETKNPWFLARIDDGHR